VGRWDVVVEKSLAGDVSHRLCLRRDVELWWEVSPARQQREWESHQRFFAIEGGEGCSELDRP
jgi:hypothetical protein